MVYGAGKGNMTDKNRVGSIYYNRGVLTGIVIGRGDPGGAGQVRQEAAHRRAGPLGAGEPATSIRRGSRRSARPNFIQPLKVTCADHEGGGAVKFQQWDGTKWKIISDWIQADKELVRPLIEESAAKYAKENNITQRDCTKEKS